MTTPIAVFGPGVLIATRTDITPGAPINVGYVQEFSIEVAGTTKQLFGQNQFPLVAARATIKATGKFKAATVSSYAMNSLFYAQSFTAGGISWVVGSTYTLSTLSTQIQVGSSLSFNADLGVTYAVSGLPLQRVSTGSEALGFYSMGSTTPGLYNFSTADTYTTAGGVALKVTYSQSTTAGQSLIVTNQLIGNSPTLQLDYYTNLNQPTAKPFVVRIYQAITDKHMMQFKLEDFMIPEWDFSLFANSQGQVYDMVWPELD
jgi:hypothetical protein